MILPPGAQPPPPKDPWEPDAEPQKMLEELSDVMAEVPYDSRECPFKEGEIVTPKDAPGIRGHGRPHMVMKVFEEYQYSELVAGQLIRPYDMIVAVSLYGKEHRFPENSASYEPFVIEEAGSDET